MNRATVILALLSVSVACSDGRNHTAEFQATPLHVNEGEVGSATPLQQVQDVVARSSNETVLDWCRDGKSYNEFICKQHLRGRMSRFGCELTVSYDEVRTRWIASYELPGRYQMMPDDAFFAFLEDEDFCEPKQPDPAMNNMVSFTGADAWSDK